MLWQDTGYYAGADQATVVVSLVTATIVGVVVCPGLAGYALFQAFAAHRRARDARRAATAGEQPTLPSGRVALRGRVSGPIDERPVVKLAIEQQGDGWRDSDGDLQHRWSDVRRTVDARPFDLRLAGGAVVRVAADPQTIVDHPRVTEAHAGDRRVVVAKVCVGDETFVEGVLGQRGRRGNAYRSAPSDYDLSAGDGQPLVVSKEPLEERHVRRTAMETGAACVLAVVVILVHSVALAPFWGATLRGTHDSAAITSAVRWTVTDESSPREHYGVYVTMPQPDGTNHRFEVSQALYEFVQSRKAGSPPEILPMVRPPFGSAWFIGPRPTLSNPACALLWFVMIVVAGAYSFLSHRFHDGQAVGGRRERGARPLR